MSFEFDTRAFEASLGKLRDKVIAVATQSVHDTTDNLLAESTKLAPSDKGILRTTAFVEVDEADGRVVGEVYYSATEDNGSGPFNYALYMHEFGGNTSFANPTTPGTQPKYLSEPLKRNSDKYKRWLAEDVRKALSDG